MAGRSIQLVGIPSLPPASGICVECKSRACAHVVKPLRRPLTPREQSLIRLIASGLSNKEIGEEIGITEGSVSSRNSLLFRKMGFRSRHDVTTWAFQNAALIGLHGSIGRTA